MLGGLYLRGGCFGHESMCLQLKEPGNGLGDSQTMKNCN